MAETEDLKSFQCRFESDWGHVPLSFLNLDDYALEEK